MQGVGFDLLDTCSVTDGLSVSFVSKIPYAYDETLGMVMGFHHTVVSQSRVTRVRVRVQISEPLPTPPPVTAGKGFDGGYECLAGCLDCRIAQIADWQV